MNLFDSHHSLRFLLFRTRVSFIDRMSVSPVFLHLNVFEKCFELRIRINAKGINEYPPCSIITLDAIDNRFIIGIAHSFEAMILENGKFFRLEGFSHYLVLEMHYEETRNWTCTREPSSLQQLLSLFCRSRCSSMKPLQTWRNSFRLSSIKR